MKRNIFRHVYIICVCIIVCFSGFKAEAAEDGLTATEAVADINVGWSLGNSLNTHDNHTAINNNKIENNSVYYYETLWWNPQTTQEMINTVRDAGFNTLRIPVTYYNHIDKNGVIDKEWLDRVAQVVQYGLNADMYVIINIHHDTGQGNNKYIQANLNNIDVYQAYVESIWGQVARHFKDYDTRLIFEGMNETLDMSAQNPWYGNKNSWEAMNILNQSFVDVVRKSGGKNTKRNLIINTYGAQTTNGPLEYFRLPKDSVNNHLIVGVHTYISGEKDIKGFMGTLNYYFVKKGIPVIVGEFGTPYWTNINIRIASAIHFMNYGNMYGIKCIWWDDGGNYKLLNRKNNTWQYPDIVERMMYAIEIAKSIK